MARTTYIGMRRERMRKVALDHGVLLHVPELDLRREVVQHLRQRGLRVRQDRAITLAIAQGNTQECMRTVRLVIGEWIRGNVDLSRTVIMREESDTLFLAWSKSYPSIDRMEDIKAAPSSTSTIFCDVGSFLALQWMRTAARIVEGAALPQEHVIRKIVDETLDELLMHRLTCDQCGK